LANEKGVIVPEGIQINRGKNALTIKKGTILDYSQLIIFFKIFIAVSSPF